MSFCLGVRQSRSVGESSDDGFLEDQNFYIICGDRHWQYHSIHPIGFEEFSTGALVDGNSRLGRSPGDPESTDPEGLIEQPYTRTEPSGGFLHVTISPGERPTATNTPSGARECRATWHPRALAACGLLGTFVPCLSALVVGWITYP